MRAGSRGRCLVEFKRSECEQARTGRHVVERGRARTSATSKSSRAEGYIYIYLCMRIWICILCVDVNICVNVWWIVSAPRQRLASVLGLLLSDKSSHHFRDLYLWLVFVLASPVPPGFNVDCDLPLIWCGHFLDKSSHRPKHTCANIDFWGSGGARRE